MKNTNALINYSLLFTIALIWGSQFLLNEIAILELPPIAIACYRVIFAALTLTILTKLFGKNFPKVSYPLSIKIRIFLIALFEAVIPFFLIAWGQKSSDSTHTAVLIGTIPIFTSLMVALFIPSEKVTIRTAISICIGFIGLIILLYPQIDLRSFANLYDDFAILLGAICFAVALVLIRTLENIPPLYLMRQVLLIAAIPMSIILVVFYPHSVFTLHSYTFWSILLLGVFCSGIALLLYAILIERAGATFTSLCNYLVPLVGALLGVSLMQDPFGLHIVVALVVILAALVINQSHR